MRLETEFGRGRLVCDVRFALCTVAVAFARCIGMTLRFDLAHGCTPFVAVDVAFDLAASEAAVAVLDLRRDSDLRRDGVHRALFADSLANSHAFCTSCTRRGRHERRAHREQRADRCSVDVSALGASVNDGDAI